MPIYAKPVRLLIREMIPDLGLEPGKTFTKQDVLEWFRSKYPQIKEGTVSCHLTRMTTNAPSRVHYRPKQGEDDLFYQVGPGRYRLYNPGSDPPPIYEVEEKTKPEDSEEARSRFAYESDLRDYLADNLSLLEQDLKLYTEDDGEITGVEYPAGDRNIDILAVDREGNYVVIELKVSKGYERAVGQLAYYMAWVERNLAEEGKKVRGMIVARNVSEELRLACRKVPGVELFEYKLSVKVNKVEG